MKIHQIEVGFLKTNCIILYDEVTLEAIIFDPGGGVDVINQYIHEKNLKLVAILITHGHLDHVAGVYKLKKRYNCDVYMHEKEYYDIKKKGKHRIKFEIDCWIDPESIIDFRFVRFKAILIKGHSNYSICFYDQAHKILISGDTLFYHSVGTGIYYDGPEDDLLKYIRDILFKLPEDTIVYPGHKNTTTIMEEKLNNPYLSNPNTVDPWLVKSE